MFVVDRILGDLESFSLNDNNKNLQFTGESDMQDIFFLDVYLTGEMGKVSTSLYRKPLSDNTLFTSAIRTP